MSVHLLDPAKTKNLQAWFAQHEECLQNCSRLAIVAVNETDEQATSQVLYFNMNEIWISWAADKLGDCAREVRGPVMEV